MEKGKKKGRFNRCRSTILKGGEGSVHICLITLGGRRGEQAVSFPTKEKGKKGKKRFGYELVNHREGEGRVSALANKM